MLSYRLGTVNDFHCGIKQVLGYSQPHIYFTCIGEKKMKYIYPFYVGHLEYEQNDRKEKGERILKRGEGIENLQKKSSSCENQHRSVTEESS